jgi:hypothetical protein
MQFLFLVISLFAADSQAACSHIEIEARITQLEDRVSPESVLDRIAALDRFITEVRNRKSNVPDLESQYRVISTTPLQSRRQAYRAGDSIESLKTLIENEKKTDAAYESSRESAEKRLAELQEVYRELMAERIRVISQYKLPAL